MATREYDWPGSFNARDLGGLPLACGGRTRPGVLFRSGRTAAFTQDGWAAARAAGVRTIVDLRPEAERRRRDDDPVVGPEVLAGFDFVGAAVEDPENAEFRARCSPYLNHPRDYAAYTVLFAPRIAAALHAIAAATASGGVLVHCSAGRDRTGLVLGLVLRAAGVAPAVIALEDELATRAVNAHHGRRATPHPYERYLGDADLDAVVASRAAAIGAWLAGFDDPGDPAARALEAAGATEAAARVAAALGVCDEPSAPGGTQ